MKQRISALDLQILTNEIRDGIFNYRLQNIYNVATSLRQFLLKFSVPDSKKVLVLDCGNKLYLTDFERPILDTPSNFVTKLRKHLKTRRLSNLVQIDKDRVVVFEFSDGLFYLVLEFFSAGNILLLDHDRKILSLQRMVQDKGNNDRYAVNETYNMFDRSLFEESNQEDENEDEDMRTYTVEEVEGWIDQHKARLETQKADGSKKKAAKVYSIHKLLFVNASHLSGELIQKRLTTDGLGSSTSCLELDGDKSKLADVVESLNNAEEDLANLLRSVKGGINGYIVAKRNKNYVPEESDTDMKETKNKEDSLEFLYDEFHPFKPVLKGHEGDYQFIEIQGYNKTLDKFFTTIDSSKYALKIEQQKQQAKKRLAFARDERDRQIQALKDQQTSNIKKGDTIIYFADKVSMCIESVQKLVDQQMDWTNIESMIKLEQQRGSEIASMIRLPLNLMENKVSILLQDTDVEEVDNEDSDTDSDSDSDTESESDTDSDSDSDDESEDEDHSIKSKIALKSASKSKKPAAPKISVWIDLSLSPYANARCYFDAKKTAETKQAKVEKSATLALKNAERKIKQDLKKNLQNETDVLKQIRVKYWFEKFLWFVSHEGYLCLAGRDGSQTDMIYYRHVNDNDTLVSSDIEGSLKVFIKNPFKGQSIPPSTYMQAGMFAMSTSVAWNNKVTTSGWSFKVDEISKKDVDGSFLEPGEFKYLKKKQYSPPLQLVIGFGFYWLGDEETTKKYNETRISKQEKHGMKVIVDNKKKDLETLKQELNKEPTPDRAQEVSAGQENEEIEEYVQAEEEDEDEEDEEDDSVSEVASDITRLTMSTLTSSNTNQRVRGKKNKQKKAARYEAEDEDDRRLRMEVLGTLKQAQTREEEQTAKLMKQRLLESQGGRKDDSQRLQERKKQLEKEVRKYLTESESVDEDESGITNYMDILDSFINKPNPEDKIVDLVPVFAPWAALAKFKYKAKIQPGLAKKGKSLNDILHYFTSRKMDASREDTDLDWANEREIIKSSKPTDFILVITVNKLKFVSPGGGDTKSGGNSGKKGGNGGGKKRK